MKRISLFIALICFTHMNSWAMTPLSEASLSNVTGQAGVNINPDLTMNLSLGTLAWGDATGLDAPWDLTGSDLGGYTGLKNLAITTLHIRSRDTDSFGGYSSSAMWRPVTIDVATDPAMYNGATFVRLGAGALHISFDSLQLEAANGLTASSLDQILGEVYLGGLNLYINPGSYIDIFNGRGGGQCGVTMNWYAITDRIELSALSWGDSDGLPAGSLGDSVSWIAPGGSPGYAGLSNVIIDRTSVMGSFAIDVCTTSSGAYHDMNGGVVSVVHISFPTDFSLHTSLLTAEVKLDSTPQLSGSSAGTLGSIYLQGFDLAISNGSWIDIWAH